MKKNTVLIIITLFFYFLNQSIKNDIENDMLRFFMCCYFNDIIGSITFVSIINMLCIIGRYHEISKLIYIETIMLSAGLFWEYVTPLFRKNTTSDFFDLLAYLFGGFLYWIISRNISSRINKKPPLII